MAYPEPTLWEQIKLLPRMIYWRWFWKPPDYEKSPLPKTALALDDRTELIEVEAMSCEFMDRKYKTARGRDRYIVEVCCLTERQCFVDLPEQPTAYKNCTRRTWALDQGSQPGRQERAQTAPGPENDRTGPTT